MSETLPTLDLNTDPKWGDFLAAFDKEPPEDQFSERQQAMQQSLRRITETLKDVRPGKEKDEFVKTQQTLTLDFTSNATVTPPLERFKQLAKLGRTADALEANIAKQIKKSGGDQTKILAMTELDALLNKCDAIQHPVLKDYIAPELEKVRQAYGKAQKEKNGKKFFEKVQAIDTSTLQRAQMTCLRCEMQITFCETKGKQLATVLNDAPVEVVGDEDHAKATDTLQKLEVRRGRLGELNVSQGDLEKTVKTLVADYKQLQTDLGQLDWGAIRPEAPDVKVPTKTDVEKRIDKRVEAIDRLLAQAGTVLKTCNVEALKDKLKPVQDAAAALDNARQDALALDDPQARLDALDAIDTGPTMIAIAAVQDALKGVPRMMSSIDGLLKQMTDGKAKDKFTVLLGSAMTGFEKAVAEGNTGELDKLKDSLANLIADIAKETKEDKYALLLEAQFGVATDKQGPFKQNLKGTYEAFCMVPDSHVGQDKLQLVFSNHSKIMPYGEYGDSVVTMQSKMFDYTAPTFAGYMVKYKEPPFKVNGKAYMPNAFNITMLHEVGHSIDDKYSIMDPVEGTGGYGQWKEEEQADILKLCTKAITDEMESFNPTQEKSISDALNGVFVGGKLPKRPDNIDRKDWKNVEAMAKTITASGADAEPWYKPNKALKFGGRIYQEAYGGRWVSYAEGDRTGGPTVSSYQWRASGEWFACLYSVAWMKKEPLNALGGKLAEWMPQAKT